MPLTERSCSRDAHAIINTAALADTRSLCMELLSAVEWWL